jgi:hypothetical protein
LTKRKSAHNLENKKDEKIIIIIEGERKEKENSERDKKVMGPSKGMEDAHIYAYDH